MYAKVFRKSFQFKPLLRRDLNVLQTICRHKSRPRSDDKTTAATALHVLGNGSEANASSVCLSVDHKLYLFNCGEGLQRLVPQYNLKLSKCQNLFITSNNWSRVSGISGLLLTQLDSGVKHFSIHSIDSEKLFDFISFFDHKLDTNLFKLIDYRLQDMKLFNDKSVEINAVIIDSDDKNVTTIAYFCNIGPKSGQLLLDKCFHLNIPRHLLPKLLSRESVVLENGVRIDCSQVLTPEEPEQCVVIIDCPSEQFLSCILQNQEFTHNLHNSKHRIECVVHMTPECVITSSAYQSLIREFSDETKHLVLNEENPNFGLFSLHRTQYQLNSLDTKVFPLINERIETKKEIKYKLLKENRNLIECQTGLQYVLRPPMEKGLSLKGLESVNLKFLKEDALKDHELGEREGLEESIRELKVKQHLLEKSQNTTNASEDNYPEIVFLGTTSAQPTANRNVSSILVNISKESSLLLDCGEDTSGQLLRFYGSTHMQTIYANMKAIFVSHMHTDHHMGLIRLINNHFKHTNQSIVVFIPPLVFHWLRRYNKEFEDISSQYVSYSTTKLKNIELNHILTALRLKTMEAIPVIHCVDSFGVVLETEDNKKIVYSGDAEPSDQLIERGRNCHLLIHEATQDDSLVSLARDQYHSTLSEAIQVGRKMNANFTVLTHFSTRYAKMPLIPDIEYNSHDFGIAYDFMRVTIPSLNRLPLLLSPLRCLYSSHLLKLKVRQRLNERRFANTS